MYLLWMKNRGHTWGTIFWLSAKKWKMKKLRKNDLFILWVTSTCVRFFLSSFLSFFLSFLLSFLVFLYLFFFLLFFLSVLRRYLCCTSLRWMQPSAPSCLWKEKERCASRSGWGAELASSRVAAKCANYYIMPHLLFVSSLSFSFFLSFFLFTVSDTW